jgi:hypothetical protein
MDTIDDGDDFNVKSKECPGCKEVKEEKFFTVVAENEEYCTVYTYDTCNICRFQ